MSDVSSDRSFRVTFLGTPDPGDPDSCRITAKTEEMAVIMACRAFCWDEQLVEVREVPTS